MAVGNLVTPGYVITVVGETSYVHHVMEVESIEPCTSYRCIDN